MRLLLLFTLLQCTRTLACGDPGTSPVHSPADFPPAAPNASIEVYFLRAPLLETPLKGTYLGLISMWHSAVGFRADNGTFWQFEYDAKDFTGSLYPEVNPNGTFTWNNMAEVCFRPDVGQRQSYWQFSAQVATITGAQYNQLQHHVGWYTANHSSYQPFTVYKGSRDPTRNNAWLEASSCSDFTWSLLEYLRDSVGVSWGLGPLLPPATTQASFFTDSSVAPVTVSLNDPSARPGLVTFFTRLAAFAKDVTHNATKHKIKDAWDLARLILELKEHLFYIYVDDVTFIKLQLNATRAFAVETIDPHHVFNM